jgi:hypothetical protein
LWTLPLIWVSRSIHELAPAQRHASRDFAGLAKGMIADGVNRQAVHLVKGKEVIAIDWHRRHWERQCRRLSRFLGLEHL